MRSKNSRRRKRSNVGSMLGMVVLVAAILLAVCLCGFVVSILFTSHHRTEAKADDLVMNMALDLNRHNWIGQMNNVVEAARELVFTSRSAHDEVLQEYPRLKSLSERLLNEARESAEFVDNQRNSLGRELCKSAQRNAESFNQRRQPSALFNLPWIRTENLAVRSVELGTIRNVQSSARLPVAVPDLRDYDLRRRYANKDSDLYYISDRASLPSPDTDLPFSFSSLPAAVEMSVPAARLTATNVFDPIALVFDEGKAVPSSLKSLPSAVRLTAVMSVRDTNDAHAAPSDVSVVVTAITKGSGVDFP